MVKAGLGVGGGVVGGLPAGGIVGGLPAGGCTREFAGHFFLRVLVVFLGAFLGLSSLVSSSVAHDCFLPSLGYQCASQYWVLRLLT